MSTLLAFNSLWEPLAWFALGIVGALGLLALLHPRRITLLALHERGWAKSGWVADVDAPAGGGSAALVLCRMLGIAVLAVVGTIAYFLAMR